MFRKLAGNVVTELPRQVSIVGSGGLVQAGRKNVADSAITSTTSLIQKAMSQALDEAQLQVQDIDGLIAVPSLRENHFMEAHYQATSLGMFADRPHLRCKTIDTGGAGPASALLEGVRMIKYEGLECVTIVAADTVGSMSAKAFLTKADRIFLKLDPEQISSPAIPHGYDKLTAYQMKTYGVTRDQLRMAVCLESFHAGIHPDSLFRRKEPGRRAAAAETPTHDILYTSLQQVREAPTIAPNISLLECARRADGAACLILTSNRFLARQGLYCEGLPTVIGGGESSGPLYPLAPVVDESHFSCEQAMSFAYASAGNLTAKDIDFFGLYDCFPICLVRALEASGLCEKGKGGDYLQEQYERMMAAFNNHNPDRKIERLLEDPTFFPVNTHGGLLCYGAPWEAPAMYNILESVQQLKGQAKGRQIKDCHRAMVYGNGGILSASAVAILARSL